MKTRTAHEPTERRQRTLVKNRSEATTLVVTQPTPSVPDREAFQARIAARAYELYVQRGYQEGHDRDHWLEAEREAREHQPD